MALTGAVEAKLRDTLQRYTSEPTARGILSRARQQPGAPEDVGPFFEMICFGAKLFVEEPRRSALLAEIEGIRGGPTSPAGPRRSNRHALEVADEHSQRRARMLVRRLVRHAGGRDLIGIRAATALSELTRNALMYAGGGHVIIDLDPSGTVLRVVVRDEGPGIAAIDEILAGRYRSRTGMGRGLLGVRKLARHFDIHTTPQGTTVHFEMELT